MTQRRLIGFLLWIAVLCIVRPAGALDLTQVIPREDPAFQIAPSRLAIGRDGRVYLASTAYVLRIGRDGSGKQGTHDVNTQISMVAANANGTIATASAHFQHTVNLWDRTFSKLGAVNDFLVSDEVSWTAPSDVEAGASDFYGIDQSRNRIVRVGVPGRTIATYSLAKLGEDLTRKTTFFRVWERGRRFYVLCPSGMVRVVGFDGTLLWSVASSVGGNPWDGWRGGFDVDDEGRLILLNDTSDTAQVHDAEGRVAAELKLNMGDRKGRVSDLRVFGDDVILKRPHPVELFQVYDRKSGALRRVVLADAEQLTVTLGSDAWIAGQSLPLTIRLDTPTPYASPPVWHAWLRKLGVPEFTELALRDGHVVAPADGGGLYQLRISPDLGGGGGEYLVEKIIEIRQPEAKGSVSLFTPQNRPLGRKIHRAHRGRRSGSTERSAFQRRDPRLGFRDRRASEARTVPLASICVEGALTDDDGDVALARRRVAGRRRIQD